MNTWITEFTNQSGCFVIALLIALEDVFPPLPPEIILTTSGFMTTIISLLIVRVITVAIIDSFIGALILYALGCQLTAKRLECLLSRRLFRLLGFRQGDAKKAADWFSKHGIDGILYDRCIPVIRSLISIPVGIAQISLGKFCPLTTIGSTIWNALLVVLDAWVGQSWNKVVIIFNDYTTIAVIIMAIAGLYFTYRWYQKRIKKT